VVTREQTYTKRSQNTITRHGDSALREFLPGQNRGQQPLSPSAGVDTCVNHSQHCFNPTDQLPTPVGLLWSDGSVTTPSHVSDACGISQPVLPVNGMGIEDPLIVDVNENCLEALNTSSVAHVFSSSLSMNGNENCFETFSINTPTVTSNLSVLDWEPGHPNPWQDIHSMINPRSHESINSIHGLDDINTHSDLTSPRASTGTSNEFPSIFAMNQAHPGMHPFEATGALDLSSESMMAHTIQQGLTNPQQHPLNPTHAPTTPKTPCPYPTCPRTFTRTADLTRHVHSAHNHIHGRHLCHIPGCSKGQGKGYTRRDKLVEHLWRKHGELGFVKRG